MKRIYSLRRLIKQSYSQKENLKKEDKSNISTGMEHFLLIILLSFNLLMVPADITFAQVFENWNARFTGPGNGRDEPVAIAIENYQNIYVGGFGFYSAGNGLDYIVIKYNPCGNIVWSRWYNYGDDIRGVLLDKNGLMAKTTNGGSNWTTVGYVNAGTVNDVIIRNQDNIYAVGDRGKTVRTSDGGVTWQDISIQTESKLNSILSGEWNKLYAAGSECSIFFSSDNGGSWEKQPAQTSLDVIDIGFFDDNCGIAITAGGEVLKTSLGLLESGNQAGDGDNSLIVSKDEVEDNFSLIGNYPNPFNPKTTITFKIPERGFVEIKIYDVLGKEAGYYPKDMFDGGRNSIEFDGSNLASGVYFYKLNFGSSTKLGRMVLVK